ncbi:MAG: FAD binding domain-containing protein [Betaproteobacteria bacterium]
MKPYALSQPSTLQQASAQIAADGADALPLGGGTALMLMMKTGVLAPAELVNLRQTEPQWRRIELQPQGDLHIGALVTLSELEHEPAVRQAVPALVQAMKRLSNVRVRNVATVGGNLAHADPHMDLPPLLCALGAHVLVIHGPQQRQIPVEDLITGYYETSLQRGELIAKLVVPAQQQRRNAYVKITTRAADDWPTIGIGISLDIESGVIRSSALFVGAATDRPTRLQAAEQILAGRQPSEALFEQASEAAAAALSLRGDERGSASYKKQLLQVHLRRALLALAVDAEGTAR